MSENTTNTDQDLPPLLTEPEEGVPFVIDTERGLTRCAEALAAGSGPVAVDAERASGFRYGQRAFLVQLKREGSGLWLIDLSLRHPGPAAEGLATPSGSSTRPARTCPAWPSWG